MAEKEDKMLVEREYIVPLRRKVNLSSKYRRARKAVNVLKAFVKRHMKVYDNSEKLIKLDRYLNEEIWQRGIEKPPAKIKIKCKKFESGKILVELAEIPEFVKWKQIKDKKRLEVKIKQKVEEKKPEESKEKIQEDKKEEETAEKKIEEKEDIKSEVEAGMKHQAQEAKEMRHVVKNTQKGQKIKRQPIQRMALQK